MAYSVSNPPSLMVARVGRGPAIWFYSSTDAIATVDDANYFSNAKALGMQQNDVIFIVNTTGNLTSLGKVGAINATTGAAGATTALTPVP
jgi:hypothetical protein